MNNLVHMANTDIAADNDVICVFSGLLLVSFAFNDMSVEKGNLALARTTAWQRRTRKHARTE